MPNTENNSEFVSQQALNQLKKVDSLIAKTTNSLVKLLEVCINIVKELDKSGVSAKKLQEANKKVTKTSDSTKKEFKQSEELTKQRKQLTEKVVATNSQETKQVIAYRNAITDPKAEQNAQSTNSTGNALSQETASAVTNIEALAEKIKTLNIDLANTDLNSEKFQDLRIELKQLFDQLSQIQPNEEGNETSLQEKLNALNNFVEQAKAAVISNANNQIAAIQQQTATELNLDMSNADDLVKLNEATASQITLIHQKLNKELETIEKNGAEARKAIFQQDAFNRVEAVRTYIIQQETQIDVEKNDRLNTANQEYNEQLKKADGDQEKIDEATASYSSRVAEITAEAEKKRLNLALDVTKQIFDNYVATGLEEVASAEEIEKAKNKIKEEGLNKSKEINKEALEDATKTSEEEKNKKEEDLKDLMSILKKAAESTKEIGDQLFEIFLERMEKESEANEKWAEEQNERVEKLEESGVITKEQAEARKAAISQKTEKREKELAKKQAQIKKGQTVFDIILDTAAAIMGAWATNTATAPAMSIIIGALGAANLAIALATPIPEYAHGTKKHPGGLAIVGDAGREEIIKTPSGKLFKTPATDTLVNIPTNSVVYPSVEAALKDIETMMPLMSNSMAALPNIKKQSKEQININFDIDKITSAQDRSTRVLNQILYGVNKERAVRRYYALKANIQHIKTMD